MYCFSMEEQASGDAEDERSAVTKSASPKPQQPAPSKGPPAQVKAPGPQSTLEQAMAQALAAQTKSTPIAVLCGGPVKAFASRPTQAARAGECEIERPWERAQLHIAAAMGRAGNWVSRPDPNPPAGASPVSE